MEITYGIIAALVLIGLYFIGRMFFKVEEGHYALATRFGAIVRDDTGKPLVYHPGLHVHAPWIRVHPFSAMERLLDVREEGREVEVLVRDGTLLRIDPKMRFSFALPRAETFLFGMSRPVSHIREFYRSLVGQELARFAGGEEEHGSYAAIRKNRARLTDGIRLRKAAIEERYGIDYLSSELAEILPPADLAEALNSVQKAVAQKETLYKRVQAECEQQIASAEHGVEIARLRAEAVESEIGILGAAVGDLDRSGTLESYLERRRDEAASASKILYRNA